MVRALLGDPVSSAVNTFSNVNEVFQRDEQMAMRRELLNKEKLESTQRMKERDLQMQKLQSDIDETKRLRMNSESIRNAKSAMEKFNTGVDLTPDENTAFAQFFGNTEVLKGKPPKEWPGMIQDFETVGSWLDQNGTQILGELSKGKGVYLDESQAEPVFNSLNRALKSQINRGGSQYGEGADKRISRIFISPDGMMTPLLRVEDQDRQQVYYAPATYDRGTDPESPVLQMPTELFTSYVDIHRQAGKLLNAWLIKMGDKGATEAYDEAQKKQPQNDAIMAGHEAASAILKSNPNASANELYDAAVGAARGYAKTNGVTLDSKSLIDEFDKFYRQRTAKPYTGTIKEDSEGYLITIGEGGKAKRVLDDSGKPVKAKPTKSTSKGTIKEDAQGYLITIDAEGNSTKVTDESGNPVKGKVKTSANNEQFITLENGDVVAIEKGTHKVTPILGPEGKPLKKTPEMSVATSRAIEVKSKEVKELIDKDYERLPSESSIAQKVRNRSDEILEKEPGKTSNQIYQQVIKEFKIPPKMSDVTKEMKGKPKGRYKVEGHAGTWDGKEFTWD